VDGNRGINQIAAERTQPRQRPILIGASEPAISDYIRSQDGREFPVLGHDACLPPQPRLHKPKSAAEQSFSLRSGRYDVAQINADQLFGRSDSFAGREISCLCPQQ
jgi:hypothetical protein